MSPAMVTEATRLSETRVRDALTAWPGVLFEDGSVIGFWGLALPEMGHRFLVDGRLLYAWCSWDALFIPELIGRAAQVESKDPVSGGAGRSDPSPRRRRRVGGQEHLGLVPRSRRGPLRRERRPGLLPLHPLLRVTCLGRHLGLRPSQRLSALDEALDLGRRVNRARGKASCSGLGYKGSRRGRSRAHLQSEESQRRRSARRVLS